jgi:hypothetical protein
VCVFGNFMVKMLILKLKLNVFICSAVTALCMWIRMVRKTVLVMKYQSCAEASFIIKLTLGIYDGI